MPGESAAGTKQFEELLESLYPQWKAFLARAHSSLRNSHGDLVQQAAEDLINYAREHDWNDVKDWVAFGFRILHRRIADQYRGDARRWAREPPTEALATIETGLRTELVVHYESQLKKLVAILTGMDDADRLLLLTELLEDENPEKGPMPAAQRKRISRLRAKLREQIDEPNEAANSSRRKL